MSEPATEPVTAPEPSAAPAPPAVKPRRTQQVILLAVIGVLVLAIVGIGVGLYVNRAPAKMTVTGGISVTASGAFYPTQEVLDLATHPGAAKCPADPTSADIPGSQIVITDAASKTVGIGTIGQPVWQSPPTFVPQSLSAGGMCLIPFQVTGVSKGSTFYTIAITGHGSVKFTSAQMSQPLSLDLH